jgi:hypothetical protein
MFVFTCGAFPAKYIGEPEGWIIWSDDSDSNWYTDTLRGESVKEIAWENVDICGKCSPGSLCFGGICKTIFGKTFDNVCRTTFRFDNPSCEAVECAKRLVEIRINNIHEKDERRQ